MLIEVKKENYWVGRRRVTLGAEAQWNAKQYSNNTELFSNALKNQKGVLFLS